jgi:hypothetical protein
VQATPSPEEVAELEIALERSRRVPAFRAFLLLCWGLITAKCLLIQWAILTYHTPINGVLFVWAPSFLIFGVITLFYARRLFEELPHMPLSGRVANATWIACAAAFFVLVLAAAVYGEFSNFLLPAFAAALLGTGCFINSVVSRRRLFKVIAIAWWLASLWLFGHDNPGALPWMSLFLFLLQVLPFTWLCIAAHRAARAASAK